MPEATKDLPDPLEETPSSASSSPDDLLSQMAEEAIDKLIADADKGLPAAAPSGAVTPDEFAALAEAMPAIETTAPGTPDQPPNDIPAAAGSDEPADAEGSLSTEAMQGELDSLFNQLDDAPTLSGDPSPSPAAETEPAAPVPSDLPSAGIDADPASGPADIDASPLDTATAEPAPVAERRDPPSSLAMPPPVDVPADIANDDGHGAPATESAEVAAPSEEAEAAIRADVKALLDDAVEQDPAPPGILVKPLQWLNAPFVNLSDEARDTIGQIAIVTLINALAVILYVIIFRR